VLIHKRLAQELLNAEKRTSYSRFEKDAILAHFILTILMRVELISNMNLAVKLMPISVKNAQNVRILLG